MRRRFSPVYGLLGVSIELPFAQRNQGPRAVTARQREGVRTRIELEARRLSRDVVAAWNAYEARRLELERITQRAMPAAAKTLAFAEAGWQAGRFDLFRLLTAARDALRLRANRIDVLESAWIARIELERAVGEEVTSMKPLGAPKWSSPFSGWCSSWGSSSTFRERKRA